MQAEGQFLVLASGVSGRTTFVRTRGFANNDLDGPIADLKNVSKYLKDKSYFGEYSLEAGGQSKDAVLTKMESLFRTKSKRKVLWYSGHGNIDDGAWVFKRDERESLTSATPNQCVTPLELVNLWQKCHVDGSHLLIISDSCYSAHWKSLHDKDPTISVQCASELDQLSEDTGADRGGNLTISLIHGLAPSWGNVGWWCAAFVWLIIVLMLGGMLHFSSIRDSRVVPWFPLCALLFSAAFIRFIPSSIGEHETWRVAHIFGMIVCLSVWLLVVPPVYPAVLGIFLLCSKSFNLYPIAKPLFWRPPHRPSWKGDNSVWSDVITPLDGVWR
jgi:hypothetical protein